MKLQEIIHEFHTEFTNLNLPASTEDLRDLEQAIGGLPDQALILYKDHNGSAQVPQARDRKLAARLMPIGEMIATQATLTKVLGGLPAIGPLAWMWSDDNSNYCGVYTGGPLRGWLCILDHEEPILTPAFRSIESFTSRLLTEARRKEQSSARDILSVPREVPGSVPDEVNDEPDLRLALHFREQYNHESREAMRWLCAVCSICLTPFGNTADVTAFLEDRDTWIPEAAVRLLEIRNWKAGTEQLEKLAREGRPNGDSAAMRLLARMKTADAYQSIARLKGHLQGQKLKALEMWTRPGIHLQPPSW